MLLTEIAKGTDRPLSVPPLNDLFSRTTVDGPKIFFHGIDKNGKAANYVTFEGGSIEKVDDFGWLYDCASDGTFLIYELQGRPAGLGWLDVTTLKRRQLLNHPKYSIVTPSFSPDNRWIACVSAPSPGHTRIIIIPYKEEIVPTENQWVEVSDGLAWEVWPRWSPDGNMLYFVSDRDGFRCLWAQRLEGESKQPMGKPLAVCHFHSARLSLNAVDVVFLAFCIRHDKVVFNMAEETGNLWMAKFQQP